MWNGYSGLQLRGYHSVITEVDYEFPCKVYEVKCMISPSSMRKEYEFKIYGHGPYSIYAYTGEVRNVESLVDIGIAEYINPDRLIDPPPSSSDLLCSIYHPEELVRRMKAQWDITCTRWEST